MIYDTQIYFAREYHCSIEYLNPKPKLLGWCSDERLIRLAIDFICSPPNHAVRNPSFTLTMSPKTVLITGCSEGGIGHSLALEWHNRGYRVFATARKLDAMSSLAAVGIECLTMDVTDSASLKKVAEEISQMTGSTLDVLVNNAGLGIFFSLAK